MGRTLRCWLHRSQHIAAAEPPNTHSLEPQHRNASSSPGTGEQTDGCWQNMAWPPREMRLQPHGSLATLLGRAISRSKTRKDIVEYLKGQAATEQTMAVRLGRPLLAGSGKHACVCVYRI